MGSIKDRNDIKKRQQEYTEELYKKDLHDPDNHDGVITHLEPDILECEVKWALGSIIANKPSGGGGIPVELFQILKDDAVKVMHSICQQIWKTQQWPQIGNMSVFIPIPKKGNVQTTAQLHLFHMLARSCSKSSKLGFNSMLKNLQMYKLNLEKAEGSEIKLPTSNGSWRKQESFRKTSASASLTMLKLLTVRITTNCGKFLKRWEYQTTLPEKPICRSRSNS